MKMNKLFCTMCLVGGFALVMSSCKKNEQSGTISFLVPDFETVEAEPGEDKAYIDFNGANKFRWNGNDAVMMYNLGNDGSSTRAVYTCSANAEGQYTADFTGDDLGTKKAYGFFAFYPASKVENFAFDPTDNRQIFNVEPEQTYTLVNGNPTVDPASMALAIDMPSPTSNATLKHVFGVCRVRLKGNGKVTKIVLRDNKMSLAGTVDMKLHEVKMNTFSNLMNNYQLVADGASDMNPTFVSAWNSYRETLGYHATPITGRDSHEITLNVPSVQLKPNTATPFYISVRPGAFIQGFEIDVYLEGENVPRTITKYGNPKTSYAIKAGVITGFAPDALN